MNQTVSGLDELDRDSSVLPYTGVSDDVVAELCSALFSSLRRSDQRRRAEQYLSGLLTANGRKSIRHIAEAVGGDAAEQRLHHFISASTWDWRPIREALAQFLERIMTVHAWVVRPFHIPKSGEHSVGVGRQYLSDLGETRNGQQAFGVWFANEEISAPVNWRLHLPATWINDEIRRRSAEIPENIGLETLVECGAKAVFDVARSWTRPSRPVVLDVRATDATAVIEPFGEAGIPVMTRISGACRFEVADPALPGHGYGALPAQQVLASVRGLRRAFQWVDPVTGCRTAVTLAAAVRVRLPETRPTADRGSPDLLLVGEWHGTRRSPDRLWLTDRADLPLETLTRLARLACRVVRDFGEEGRQAGLSDFGGRSFRGWHRHMTLASAAHTLAMLRAVADGGESLAG